MSSRHVAPRRGGASSEPVARLFREGAWTTMSQRSSGAAEDLLYVDGRHWIVHESPVDCVCHEGSLLESTAYTMCTILSCSQVHRVRPWRPHAAPTELLDSRLSTRVCGQQNAGSSRAEHGRTDCGGCDHQPRRSVCLLHAPCDARSV